MNPGTSNSSSENKSVRIENLLHEKECPLTLSDIQGNLKDLSKKDIESSLKSLLDSNIILMKTYGKQNIYIYNFKYLADINKLIEEVNILIARLEKYFAKIQVKEKEIADLEMKITTLSVTAIEELDKEYAFLTEKIDALTAEIDQLQKQNASTAQVDPKELQQLKRKFDSRLDEFHKRKRMCHRVVDAVLEGYPKTKKMLMDEMQIETDEQVNFDITDYSA